MKTIKVEPYIWPKDLNNIAAWLAEHGIDAAWITLDQTISFRRNHVWYDQYRHSKDGEVVLDDDKPVKQRMHHRCWECRDVAPPMLMKTTIEDDDE